MSVDTLTKRKSDEPSGRKSKKPRTSEGKKDKHSKPRSSDKHKSRKSAEKPSSEPGLVVANDADSDENAGAVSAYRRMFPYLHMAVPPVFAADPVRALAELFDTMLLQYVPELEGVLVTHHADSKCFKRASARIEADGAFGFAPAKVGCLVWSPRIGMKLEGKISLSSPSHVSLLLDGLFNASISSQHIDLSQWEFVHEDPEAADQEGGQGGDEESQPVGEDDEDAPHSLGYWRNKHDFGRLGGTDGKVTFTVVSMTVAKRMLTLHGSLLSRPFSVPPPDDQEQQSIESMLPPLEGSAREMTASQRIMAETLKRRAEERRERQNAAKQEQEAETTSKTQSKRVRWDDDEVADNAAARPANGHKAPSQGKKTTFD